MIAIGLWFHLYIQVDHCPLNSSGGTLTCTKQCFSTCLSFRFLSGTLLRHLHRACRMCLITRIKYPNFLTLFTASTGPMKLSKLFKIKVKSSHSTFCGPKRISRSRLGSFVRKFLMFVRSINLRSCMRFWDTKRITMTNSFNLSQISSPSLIHSTMEITQKFSLTQTKSKNFNKASI